MIFRAKSNFIKTSSSERGLGLGCLCLWNFNCGAAQIGRQVGFWLLGDTCSKEVATHILACFWSTEDYFTDIFLCPCSFPFRPERHHVSSLKALTQMVKFLPGKEGGRLGFCASVNQQVCIFNKLLVTPLLSTSISSYVQEVNSMPLYFPSQMS